MKLRNRKTGEIPDKIETIAYIQWSKMIMMVYINNDGERIVKHYDSLETFNEEWQDYEEPKDYYFIRSESLTVGYSPISSTRSCKNRKEIGNYFESKEEAEKAVEKLKAFKRLKDKGFRVRKWDISHLNLGTIEFFLPNIVAGLDEYREDLDLLFGGEE